MGCCTSRAHSKEQRHAQQYHHSPGFEQPQEALKIQIFLIVAGIYHGLLHGLLYLNTPGDLCDAGLPKGRWRRGGGYTQPTSHAHQAASSKAAACGDASKRKTTGPPPRLSHLLCGQPLAQQLHQACTAQAPCALAVNVLEHPLGRLQPHLPAVQAPLLAVRSRSGREHAYSALPFTAGGPHAGR